MALDVYLRDLAAQDAASEESAEAARREAVRTTRGKYAHVALTPELRRQMKDQELQREAARFEASPLEAAS